VRARPQGEAMEETTEGRMEGFFMIVVLGADALVID